MLFFTFTSGTTVLVIINMKYKKGTFVVVPNLDVLEGQPTEVQTIFMWLCTFADDEGQCFPSRSNLAKKCSITTKTLDKYLTQIVELGLLEKTTRKKKGGRENMSNLYQIVVKDSLGRVNDDPTPREGNDPVTISNINYTNLNIKSGVETPDKEAKKKSKKQLRLEAPFSFEVELKLLRDSTWKPNQIIHNYFVVKKYKFTNYGQFDTEIAQSKNHAIKLEGYSSKQINEAMNYCIDNMKDIPWNLSTVVKIIANVVNT